MNNYSITDYSFILDYPLFKITHVIIIILYYIYIYNIKFSFKFLTPCGKKTVTVIL